RSGATRRAPSSYSYEAATGCALTPLIATRCALAVPVAERTRLPSPTSSAATVTGPSARPPGHRTAPAVLAVTTAFHAAAGWPVAVSESCSSPSQLGSVALAACASSV